MRQERIRIERHRTLQKLLSGLAVAALVIDHAAVDQALVVIALGIEHAREVLERLLRLALVEVRLTEEVGKLVVVAIELVRRLESPHRALDVESEERVLGVLEVLQELLALVAAVERRDSVLDGHEALALLQRQQLVVHLGFPQVAPLVAPEDRLALEQLAQRRHAGLRDEDVLLLLVERAQQLTHGFRRALHHFFEDRDALEQMLVEGKILLRRVFVEAGLFLARGGAGEHQELLVTATAELLLVGVEGAADLAIH